MSNDDDKFLNYKMGVKSSEKSEEKDNAPGKKGGKKIIAEFRKNQQKQDLSGFKMMLKPEMIVEPENKKSIYDEKSEKDDSATYSLGKYGNDKFVYEEKGKSKINRNDNQKNRTQFDDNFNDIDIKGVFGQGISAKNQNKTDGTKKVNKNYFEGFDGVNPRANPMISQSISHNDHIQNKQNLIHDGKNDILAENKSAQFNLSESPIIRNSRMNNNSYHDPEDNRSLSDDISGFNLPVIGNFSMDNSSYYDSEDNRSPSVTISGYGSVHSESFNADGKGDDTLYSSKFHDSGTKVHEGSTVDGLIKYKKEAKKNDIDVTGFMHHASKISGAGSIGLGIFGATNDNPYMLVAGIVIGMLSISAYLVTQKSDIIEGAINSKGKEKVNEVLNRESIKSMSSSVILRSDSGGNDRDF